MKISKVIQSALRKLGIVGYGSVPTDDQYADALITLQSLYRMWITGGCFGRLSDAVPIGDGFIASPNSRVLRTADNPNFDLQLPTVGVPDNAIVIFEDQVSGAYEDFIYDAQLKDWFSISDLDVSDTFDPDDDSSVARLHSLLSQQAPLSYRDVNGLASRLATELSPDYGVSVAAPVAIASRNFSYSLTHNYAQPDGYIRQNGTNIVNVVGDSDPNAFSAGPDSSDLFETS